MRLSSTLSLSLLLVDLASTTARVTNTQQPEAKPATPAQQAAAVAKATTSAAARRRRLEKAEGRFQTTGNGNNRGGNGNGNSGGGGGSTVDGTDSGGTFNLGGGNGNGNNSGNGGSRVGTGGTRKGNGNGKKNLLATRLADDNHPAITFPSGEFDYQYGDPIDIAFELTNDLVDYETLMGLDVTMMAEWRMGVFMRMADPQGGALQPIDGTVIVPSIVDAVTRRKLQKEEEVTTVDLEYTGATNAEEEEDPLEEMETTAQRTAPTLNFSGTATLSATDATTLNPLDSGTGFDIYLLDEKGAAIIGPATFYMVKTADMELAEAEANVQNSNHPLAKYNHSQKKKPKGQGYGSGGAAGAGGKYSGKVQGGIKPNSKGQGFGSGANGGLILGTGGANIASYTLVTDKIDYVVGDDVTVTYDLSPAELTDGGRRLMRMLVKGGNGNGNGNGNNGGGNSGGGNDSPPAQEDTTTTQATTTNAATTTPEVTTTTTPDMFEPIDQEEFNLAQTEVDNTDKTLFKLGVFMRMAHPQGGSLDPILDVPFCVDPADTANCIVEDLERGDLSFSTTDLNLGKYGTGYDVWVLNGSGAGVAGPFTFYVEE